MGGGDEGEGEGDGGRWWGVSDARAWAATPGEVGGADVALYVYVREGAG
jgi:hypothetical protein